jgi:hypothetical protein
VFHDVNTRCLNKTELIIDFEFMKKLIFGIILLLGSVFVALALLEFAVRMIPEQENPILIEREPNIGTIYRKNIDSEILAEDNKRIVRFKTNSYGFVGEEWDIEKATGTIRIANHGDSMTAAGDVFYEDNYVSAIGRTLRGEFSVPVESINFGVGKQGTLDALNTYINYSRQGVPDIVALWIYLNNDFSDNYLEWKEAREFIEWGEKKEAEKKPESRRRSLVQYTIQESELIQLLFRAKNNSLAVQKFVSFVKELPGVKRFAYDTLLGEVPQEFAIIHTLQDEEKNQKAIELTREHLLAFKSIVAEDEINFYAFLIPGQIQIDEESEQEVLEQYPQLPDLGFDKERSRRTMRGLLEELEIPFHDLTPVFAEGCDGDKVCPMYNCQYCHLSEFGHARVAEEASEVLFSEFFSQPEATE